MSWVRQLAVLAERFQQNIQTTDVDWNKNFLSDSPLLHQINCEDLVALARGISEEDIADFRTLDRNDFSDETKRLRGLGKGWQILSEDARACAVIDSDMGETIGKLAKVMDTKALKIRQANHTTAIGRHTRLLFCDSFTHGTPTSKRLSPRRLLYALASGQQLCQIPSAMGQRAGYSIPVSTYQGVAVYKGWT